ncbi:MAG: GNAT family N-acetyltransferase [Clostridia bacterium]|nr:GNAT family N-acetyltransferase [Clostridia bacterium]
MSVSSLEIEENTLKERFIDNMLQSAEAQNYDCDVFYKIQKDKQNKTYFIIGIYNGLELNLSAYTLEKNAVGKIKPSEIGYLQASKETNISFGQGASSSLHISSLYATRIKKNGIGSGLLSTCLDFARNNTDVDYISLTSLSESVGFYEKLNFKKYEQDFIDCTMMFKDVHDMSDELELNFNDNEKSL